jgi:hypothetical protein
VSFFAGDEFSYKLGYAVDNERDNVDIRVDLGEFASIAAYNRVTKSIDVQKGATSARDTRDYRIDVYLTDDSRAVLLNEELDLYLRGKKHYSFVIRVYDAEIDWREERRKKELAKAKVRATGNIDKAELKYEIKPDHIDEWYQSKPLSTKAPRPFPISMGNSGVF